MPGPVKTRTYDNARRAAAARRTEQRVVETAQRLLLERGYAGLAMADLAAEAGVSVPLLYKVFGPKPQLVKRIYDVLLAGDVDPEPVAERPALQALAADPDPRGKLARYAALGRAMAERAGPLVSALLAAARAGEPELRAFAATIDRERLAGASALAAHLAERGALSPALAVDRARDLIWLHTAPDTYRLLVLERGWALDDYERWLATSLTAALLPAPVPPTTSS
ncbi:MAG: TetR/AcrR family transcriptional regulator [Actinomycetota bacterium]